MEKLTACVAVPYLWPIYQKQLLFVFVAIYFGSLPYFFIMPSFCNFLL